MTKKFVSMFLALVMCLSLAAPAWAADTLETEEVDGKKTTAYSEEDISPAAECSHSNKKFYTSGVRFESYMSMGHFRIPYVRYRCTDCGKILDPEPTDSILESHTLVQGAFTGNHHHKGNTTLHLAEYQFSCSYCDYYTTKYISYTCPGGQNGGVCIMPTCLYD